MKVGVVIPCHNYGHWVQSAIESAINQSYLCEDKSNIVLSICNDGSKDDTDSVINSMITNNAIDGVETFYSKNRFPSGPSFARNVAISKIIDKVDLIAFLDADDMMHRDKLHHMVPYFGVNDIGVAYADTENYFVNGDYTVREYREPFNFMRCLQHNIGLNNTSIVRVSALQDVQMGESEWFDNSLRTCEDYDLFLRIAKKWMIVHVPLNLTTLRIHTNNSTHTVHVDTWKLNRKAVLERARNAQ